MYQVLAIVIKIFGLYQIGYIKGQFAPFFFFCLFPVKYILLLCATGTI